MELTRYNKSTLISKRCQGSEPVVAFDTNGCFRINKTACELMGLKERSRIEFVQDKNNLENWYITINKEKGFGLRNKPNIGTGLYFNNSQLAKLILYSVQSNVKSGKVYIRKKSVKLQSMVLWFIDLSPLKK